MNRSCSITVRDVDLERGAEAARSYTVQLAMPAMFSFTANQRETPVPDPGEVDDDELYDRFLTPIPAIERLRKGM